MSQLRNFIKLSSSKPEIYPMFLILGGALSGAFYMMKHQSNSPDVVWNHHSNAEPWQHVRDGEQVKLAAYNQQYERKYHRKEW
jgi:NADH dehydrogenase (ubiquinone) 1 alpha subcomplex subunit 4